MCEVVDKRTVDAYTKSHQKNLIVQKNTTEHESNFGVIQKQRGKHNEV